MKKEVLRGIGISLAFQVFIGCGDGQYGGFDSLTGNWRISSEDNISTSGCGDEVRGFTGVLYVEQNGASLAASGTPEVSSYWTGHATNDGFEVTNESEYPCPNGVIGKKVLHLTISAISDPLKDAYGDAAYFLEASCPDNTPKCLLRSNGLTKHISN